MATYHVSAQWGNDENDGLTKETAVRSLNKFTGNHNFIIYSGKYISQWINASYTGIVIGIGNVILEGILTNESLILGNYNSKLHKNLNIRNYTPYNEDFATTQCFYYNCKSWISGTYNILTSNQNISLSRNKSQPINNSFYGVSGLLTIPTGLNQTSAINNIIHSKPTKFQNVAGCKVQFWDFYSVPIDIDDGNGQIVYDNSTGKTITDLRNRCAAFYGGAASDYFPNCKIYDAATTPCFIDKDAVVKEGFYLHPDSPSAKRDYITGKHIGALPVADAVTALSGWTVGSNIDTTVGNPILLDPSVEVDADNTITSPIMDTGKVKLLEGHGIGIIEALRNGEVVSIDRNTATDAELLGNTDTLINGSTYVCEGESVSVSDSSTTVELAIGETFYTPDDGSTWMLTAAGTGALREIYLDKPAILYMKVSKTDAALTTANKLKFYIQNYDSSNEEKVPMCNIDSSGIPVLGDADVGFEEFGHATYGDAVRVQYRYFQYELVIQTANARS